MDILLKASLVILITIMIVFLVLGIVVFAVDIIEEIRGRNR